MQQIHINRNRINSIEFDDPEITIPLVPGNECSFELPIINYGSPTHVYLSVSDALRKNVRFLYDNVYVANQEFAPVVIKLPADLTTLEGEIKVTTGISPMITLNDSVRDPYPVVTFISPSNVERSEGSLITTGANSWLAT